MILAEGHAVALQELRCNLAPLDSGLEMFLLVCVIEDSENMGCGTDTDMLTYSYFFE